LSKSSGVTGVAGDDFDTLAELALNQRNTSYFDTLAELALNQRNTSSIE